MLNLRQPQYGFSMIELLVTLSIIGILMAIGAPALNIWIQNGKIRTAADSIQNGLQLARSEAVHLNTAASFQLTTSLDSSCAFSTSGTNWVVSLDTPTGACNGARLNSAFPVDDAVNNPTPRIIQTKSGAEGAGSTIASSESGASAAVYTGQITFTGLGRVNPASIALGNNVQINISGASGGTPLRVVVTSAGLIRMCDPAFTLASNPKGC